MPYKCVAQFLDMSKICNIQTIFNKYLRNGVAYKGQERDFFQVHIKVSSFVGNSERQKTFSWKTTIKESLGMLFLDKHRCIA